MKTNNNSFFDRFWVPIVISDNSSFVELVIAKVEFQ